MKRFVPRHVVVERVVTLLCTPLGRCCGVCGVSVGAPDAAAAQCAVASVVGGTPLCGLAVGPHVEEGNAQRIGRLFVPSETLTWDDTMGRDSAMVWALALRCCTGRCTTTLSRSNVEVDVSQDS